MKLFIDQNRDKPAKWPWFNMDAACESHLVTIPAPCDDFEVFYGESTYCGCYPYKNRDEMIQKVAHLFGCKAIQIIGIARSSDHAMPLLITDTRQVNVSLQYVDCYISVNEYRLDDIPHLELEIKSCVSVNGVPGDWKLSLNISDGRLHGQGSGRCIYSFSFDDDKLEQIDTERDRVIAALKNNEFDLTPEYLVQEAMDKEADGILKELGDRPSYEQFLMFAEKYEISPIDIDNILWFYERYSSYAAGGENTVADKVRVAAIYRRAQFLLDVISSEARKLHYPLSRDDYEAFANKHRFKIISDEECIDILSLYKSYLRKGIPSDLNIDVDSVHALRGVAVEMALLEAPHKPVVKCGQIWEQCSCGNEPVYLPLMVCDKCWPG